MLERGQASRLLQIVPSPALASHRVNPYIAVRTIVLSGTLRGRDAETVVLDGLLVDARADRSGVLVLRGEPGIGKTALLDLAVGLAQGFRVLRARGVESESEIAFAGLQELFRPVTERLVALPERQRAVLAGALALGPPAAGDPLAVRAATLSMLAAEAKDRPALVVVDDAHWLDAPSAEALAFAARRLDSEGLVMLFAIREAEPSVFEPAGLRVLRVGGLAEEPATRLLVDHAGRDVCPLVMRKLLRVADGNPLALQELPSTLSAAELAGREPLQELLPVGAGIQRAFARRLEALPSDARGALLVAAAGAQDQSGAVMAALRAVHLAEAAFEPAERAGLISIGDGSVNFRHPLLRSVIYQAASGKERRRAHAALAAACDGAPDRRAWHSAGAAVGPDERVALALEEAAEKAAQRAGFATAARTYQRAAGLSSETDARARRLLAAAGYAHDSRRSAWASDLVSEGLRLLDAGPIRAELQHRAALIERGNGFMARARIMLSDAAEAIAREEPTRATLMLIDATIADCMTGELRVAAERARQAREYARECPPAIQQLVDAMAGIIAIDRGELPADKLEIASARMAVASAPHLPPAAEQAIAVLWIAWYSGKLERRDIRRDNELDGWIAYAREHGALGFLPYLLAAGALMDSREDRWTRATARASEAAELAEQTGHRNFREWALVTLAMVEAAQGHEQDCRSHATETPRMNQTSEIGSLAPDALAVLGLLELGLGNIPAAVEQLEQCARQVEACGVGNPNALRYEADLVEALHASGRAHDANVAARSLAQHAQRVNSPWGLAVAARCRALLAGEEHYEQEFRAALALHKFTSRFECARTQLCYGERLRRARRRSDARQQLTAALATFEQLDAAPWAERARGELRAAGARHHARLDPVFRDTLTPQELRVALIIAEGLTVREAAAQLFLSPKTIEAHLGRAYRKLGVRNRAQLTAALNQREERAA